MKKIKTFKLFESNRKEYVVRSSSPSPTGPWTDPSEVFNITCIESITVENGTPSGLKFVAGEDTGGEYAYLVIDGYTPNMDGDSFEPLIQGDVISFDESEKDDDGFYHPTHIIINGQRYPARVESEGGNTGTFLSLE